MRFGKSFGWIEWAPLVLLGILVAVAVGSILLRL